MSPKTCLRCDWQGETHEPSCPNCGARPLYVVGATPSQGAGVPERGHPQEPSTPREAGTPSTRSDPTPHPTDPVEPSGGSARSTAVFVLAALVMTITLGTWLKAHEERPASAASADFTVPETPANDGSTGTRVEGVTPSDPPRFRRQTLTEDGIPFSFRVPTGVGWERFDSLSTARIPAGPISLNRSITGPQGAEIDHLLVELSRRRPRRSVHSSAERAGRFNGRGPRDRDSDSARNRTCLGAFRCHPRRASCEARRAHYPRARWLRPRVLLQMARQERRCPLGHDWCGRLDQGIDRRCSRDAPVLRSRNDPELRAAPISRSRSSGSSESIRFGGPAIPESSEADYVIDLTFRREDATSRNHPPNARR